MSTAQSANPRIDRLVKFYANGKEAMLTGEPTPGALLDNLLGAPSVPEGAVLVANILIPGYAQQTP